MAGVQNTATHLELIFNTVEKMHFANARTYIITFFGNKIWMLPICCYGNDIWSNEWHTQNFILEAHYFRVLAQKNHCKGSNTLCWQSGSAPCKNDANGWFFQIVFTALSYHSALTLSVGWKEGHLPGKKPVPLILQGSLPKTNRRKKSREPAIPGSPEKRSPLFTSSHIPFPPSLLPFPLPSLILMHFEAEMMQMATGVLLTDFYDS